MRGTIATIFACGGFIGSFAASVYWAYWIWQLDWGAAIAGDT